MESHPWPWSASKGPLESEMAGTPPWKYLCGFGTTTLRVGINAHGVPVCLYMRLYARL